MHRSGREYGIFIAVLLGCLLLQPYGAALDDNELANFAYSIIPSLQWQARQTGRRQFAALIFLGQEEVNNIESFQFHPHDENGAPIVNNNFDYRPDEPFNYVVARPEHPYHAEEIVLQQLPRMWQRYVIQSGTPAAIILYTRLYPCTPRPPEQTHRCSDLIRSVLRESPYNTVYRSVIYNSDDNVIAPDEYQQTVYYFQDAIMIHGLPMNACFDQRMKRGYDFEMVTQYREEMCNEPAAIQSFQGCILQCLGDNQYPEIQHDALEWQKAYLLNILVDECLLNEKREACIKETLTKKIGNWWGLYRKQAFVDDLISCHNSCILKPISQPRQESKDFDDQISLMISPDDRHNFNEPTEFACNDKRRTGLLCSHVNDMFLTAGNSLCRSDHPCGYHDYDYTWCYTTIDDDWDYCCSGTCGYNGYDYLWCTAGDEWQYCGKGGPISTGSRTSSKSYPCLADHQCGLHRDVSSDTKYFWCYLDVDLSWDYCCSPEPEDNECKQNGGESYKWCKTSYDKEPGSWEYCYY